MAEMLKCGTRYAGLRVGREYLLVKVGFDYYRVRCRGRLIDIPQWVKMTPEQERRLARQRERENQRD